jgi:hypothetical protein
MINYQYGIVFAIFIGLALAQVTQAENNFNRVVRGINQITDSIENINKIIKVVDEGEKYLKENYPIAKKDVVAMINEMGKTLHALSLASSIITNFAFIMDKQQFSHELEKFREHLLERETLSSNLSNQLDLLRGHCRTIREHEENIIAKTNVPWFFKIFGIKYRKENDELYKSLQHIYDVETQHYEVVTEMSEIINLALDDIEVALGGPGKMKESKVPEAAELLHKYSIEFKSLQSKSNDMKEKIDKLVYQLD